MKIKVHLVIHDDDDHEETITDVVVLEKACQQIEQVGLTLAEAKSLLAALQQRIVERQAAAFLATCMHCQTCGTALCTKGQHSRTFRTLFGTITLMSPRLRSCQCPPHRATTFSPLMALLSVQTAPELLFMETKWASLVSYGLTVQPSPTHPGSSSLLVIQVHGSKIATREEKVAD
jgi:hypothetical protein